MNIFVGKTELSEQIEKIWINEMVLLKPLQPYLSLSQSHDGEGGEEVSLVPEEMYRHCGSHAKTVLTTTVQPKENNSGTWEYLVMVKGRVQPTRDIDFYYISMNREEFFDAKAAAGYKAQRVAGREKSQSKLENELDFYNEIFAASSGRKIVGVTGNTLAVENIYGSVDSEMFSARECRWGSEPKDIGKSVCIDIMPFVWQGDKAVEASKRTGGFYDILSQQYEGVTVFRVRGAGTDRVMFRFAFSGQDNINTATHAYGIEEVDDVQLRAVLSELGNNIGRPVTFHREVSFLFGGWQEVATRFEQHFVKKQKALEDFCDPTAFLPDSGQYVFPDISSDAGKARYMKNWRDTHSQLMDIGSDICFTNQLIRNTTITGRPHGFNYSAAYPSPFDIKWQEHGLNQETAQGTYLDKSKPFSMKAIMSCGICSAVERGRKFKGEIRKIEEERIDARKERDDDRKERDDDRKERDDDRKEREKWLKIIASHQSFIEKRGSPEDEGTTKT